MCFHFRRIYPLLLLFIQFFLDFFIFYLNDKSLIWKLIFIFFPLLFLVSSLQMSSCVTHVSFKVESSRSPCVCVDDLFSSWPDHCDHFLIFFAFDHPSRSLSLFSTRSYTFVVLDHHLNTRFLIFSGCFAFVCARDVHSKQEPDPAVF